MKNSRVDELESLRGVMALWVVIGHVLLSFPAPSALDGFMWRILCDNVRAVDLFIILSGFAIFHLLGASSDSYSRYLSRRFLRLFPAYIICFAASVAMLPIADAAAGSVLPLTQRAIDRLSIDHDSAAHFWAHIGAHMTMLHGMIPSNRLPATDYAFLGQAWSISVEWQFYLIAPFLMWLITRRYPLAGLPIIAAVCWALYGQRWRFGSGYIGAHLWYFSIGCSSYFAWRSGHRLALAWLVRNSTVAIVGACALWVLLFPHEWHVTIWITVLLSCNAVRFGGTPLLASSISRALLTAPLRRLGKISYPLYLVHTLALNALIWGGSRAGLNGSALVGVTLVGTIAISLALAAAIHEWVEAPAISLGRRLPAMRWGSGPEKVEAPASAG